MSFTWTRFTRNGAAAIVASIAGYASYWHQVDVARRAGERVELAHVLPFSVDGLLVVASIAMVDARAEGRKPSWQTKVAFGMGIAASVGANVMSAQPTLLGRIVAAWPALALLLTVETLSSKGKLLSLARTAFAQGPEQQAQQVVDEAAAKLPVPVSPAPTPRRVGRPELPLTDVGGVVVNDLTGQPAAERTARRARNQQPGRVKQADAS